MCMFPFPKIPVLALQLTILDVLILEYDHGMICIRTRAASGSNCECPSYPHVNNGNRHTIVKQMRIVRVGGKIHHVTDFIPHVPSRLRRQ